MLRPTFAEIRLDHLRHNFLEIKKKLGNDKFICPMIKSNAYGHGDREVAEALCQEGAQFLGVALVEEALHISDIAKSCQILVFGGFSKDSLKICFEKGFIPVISSLEDINIIRYEKWPMTIHLKFNTGMNRLGFDKKDLETLRIILKSSKFIKVQGLCTHLATAEDLNQNNSTAQEQLNEFEKIISDFSDLNPEYTHALNSAGFEAVYLNPGLDSYRNMGVRPGILLYGGEPSPGIDIKPVMNLKSQIIQVHELKKGEKVSYGGIWQAVRDSIIGVLPIGYADGYPRSLSQHSKVLIGDQLVPTIGRICMDYTMVDLTDLPRLKTSYLYEEVSLWGAPQNSVSSVAQEMNTISYELLSRLGIRVPRVFKDQ